MARYQVVGILDSHLSNRQNEFGRIVERSTLEKDIRHQLHFVNRWKAWFGREVLTMKDGTEIPSETRCLARRIMHRVLSRPQRPDLSRINRVIAERDGRLFFGIVTDMAVALEDQRRAYQPRCEEIALDYGLRTLFATNLGDLLGRNFLHRLRYGDYCLAAP